MNPTPEQLQQWEEDFCADKLAGRLPKLIPIFDGFDDTTPIEWVYYREYVETEDDAEAAAMFGSVEENDGRDEYLSEYIARRMKENSTNLSISDK